MDIDGENLHANLALDRVAVFQRRRLSRGGRAHSRGMAGKRRGAGLSRRDVLVVRRDTTAAARSSPTRSSGRRRCRAATTRRARSWRFASSVMTTRSRSRCASIRRIGRWATSSSPPRPRSAGARILQRARDARFIKLDPTIAKSTARPAAPLARRAGARRRARARVRRRGASRSARHCELGVSRRPDRRSSALKLEREALELRHGHARELHELDELLEALRGRRLSGEGTNVPALTCSVSRVLSGPSRRRSASDSGVMSASRPVDLRGSWIRRSCDWTLRAVCTAAARAADVSYGNGPEMPLRRGVPPTVTSTSKSRPRERAGSPCGRRARRAASA